MPAFPERRLSREHVFETMESMRADDVDWRRGRLGLYVHFGGEDVLEVAKEAYRRFFSENALGPKAFPSLKRFEEDIVAWTADLLGGAPRSTGVVTSGGTESIFLAIKTARDWARAERPAAKRPGLVIPVSAHPAFDKAAHLLGLQVTRVPLRADYRADPNAMAAAITQDTILVAGSAPAFPHGVIDPIEDIADLARRRELWMHVDACVGGFLAPFARRLGYPIPPFDFSVDAVRSISADLHKYGFTAKGASVMLLADESLRRHLVFEFDNWPRGRYVSPTFAGTRPGGAIAAAWAVLRYLGVEGYLDIVREIMDARDRMISGIESIDGLFVVGKPDLSVIGFSAARDLDMFAVAERMTARGWFVSTMSDPPGIHLGMPTLAHAPHVNEYLADLAASVQDVRDGGLTAVSRSVSYGG